MVVSKHDGGTSTHKATKSKHKKTVQRKPRSRKSTTAKKASIAGTSQRTHDDDDASVATNSDDGLFSSLAALRSEFFVRKSETSANDGTPAVIDEHVERLRATLARGRASAQSRTETHGIILESFRKEVLLSRDESSRLREVGERLAETHRRRQEEGGSEGRGGEPSATLSLRRLDAQHALRDARYRTQMSRLKEQSASRLRAMESRVRDAETRCECEIAEREALERRLLEAERTIAEHYEKTELHYDDDTTDGDRSEATIQLLRMRVNALTAERDGARTETNREKLKVGRLQSTINKLQSQRQPDLENAAKDHDDSFTEYKDMGNAMDRSRSFSGNTNTTTRTKLEVGGNDSNNEEMNIERFLSSVDEIKNDSPSLEFITKERDELLTERVSKKNEIDQLRLSLKETTTEKEIAETNTANLISRLTELERSTTDEKATLKQECTSLQRQVADLKEDLSKKGEEYKLAESIKLKSLRDNLDALTLERDNAVRETKDFKWKIEQLQSTVDDLELERSQRSDDYVSLVKARDDLTIEKNDQTKQINQLRTSLDEVTKGKDNAEANAANLTLALTELKRTTNNEKNILLEKCAALEWQVTAEATKTEKLEGRLNAAQDSIKEFEKKVDEKTREADVVSKRITLMESLEVSKTADIDAFTCERDALMKENEALSREAKRGAKDMKVQQETYVAEKGMLEKQLQEAGEYVEELKMKGDKKVKVEVDLEEKIRLMETMVAAKSAEVDAIRFERDTIAKEKDTLLRETETKLKDAEARQVSNIAGKDLSQRRVRQVEHVINDFERKVNENQRQGDEMSERVGRTEMTLAAKFTEADTMMLELGMATKAKNATERKMEQNESLERDLFDLENAFATELATRLDESTISVDFDDEFAAVDLTKENVKRAEAVDHGREPQDTFRHTEELLRDEVKTLREGKVSLEGRVEEMKMVIRDMEKNAITQSTRLEETAKHFESVNSELIILKAENDLLRNRVKVAEETKQQFNDRIEYLRQKESIHLYRVTELQKKLNAQDNSIIQEKNNARKEVEKERKKVTELQSMLTELTHKQQVMNNCSVTEMEITEETCSQSKPQQQQNETKKVKPTDHVCTSSREKTSVMNKIKKEKRNVDLRPNAIDLQQEQQIFNDSFTSEQSSLPTDTASMEMEVAQLKSEVGQLQQKLREAKRAHRNERKTRKTNDKKKTEALIKLQSLLAKLQQRHKAIGDSLVDECSALRAQGGSIYKTTQVQSLLDELQKDENHSMEQERNSLKQRVTDMVNTIERLEMSEATQSMELDALTLERDMLLDAKDAADSQVGQMETSMERQERDHDEIMKQERKEYARQIALLESKLSARRPVDDVVQDETVVILDDDQRNTHHKQTSIAREPDDTVVDSQSESKQVTNNHLDEINTHIERLKEDFSENGIHTGELKDGKLVSQDSTRASEPMLLEEDLKDAKEELGRAREKIVKDRSTSPETEAEPELVIALRNECQQLRIGLDRTQQSLLETELALQKAIASNAQENALYLDYGKEKIANDCEDQSHIQTVHPQRDKSLVCSSEEEDNKLEISAMTAMAFFGF